MPEVSTDELTILENCLVSVREAITAAQQGDSNPNPEVQKLLEMIVESEQIVSAKLDTTDGGDTTDNTNPNTAPQQRMQ